jgi:hypothetical protein
MKMVMKEKGRNVYNQTAETNITSSNKIQQLQSTGDRNDRKIRNRSIQQSLEHTKERKLHMSREICSHVNSSN